MEAANWAFGVEQGFLSQSAAKPAFFLPSIDKKPGARCFGKGEGRGTPIISQNNLDRFTSALCSASAQVDEKRTRSSVALEKI